MSYRIYKNTPPEQNIRRLLNEKISKCISIIDNKYYDKDEEIHDLRKNFKMIRGMLRLIRDDIGETKFKKYNRLFRDMGRRLAPLRDGQVYINTLIKLQKKYKEELSIEEMDKLVFWFRDNYLLKYQQFVEEGKTIQQVKEVLVQTHPALMDLHLKEDGFGSFREGLKRVYKRGKKAKALAMINPTTKNLHEWRKRVKYLWYHNRLLREAWPKLMKASVNVLDKLSDVLGEDHDYAILHEFMLKHPELLSDEKIREQLFIAIEKERKGFFNTVKPLGEIIYVEKPAAYVSRVKTYWDENYHLANTD